MRDPGADMVAGRMASLRRTRTGVSVVIMLVAAWAAWGAIAPGGATSPVHRVSDLTASGKDAPIAADGGSQPTGTGASRPPLDEASFRARLWTAPPRPVEVAQPQPAPPPAQPPPPFTLKLVGIERSESVVEAAPTAPTQPGELIALVYDPVAMKVQRVVRGGQIGRYMLDEIHPTHAIFADTQHPGRPTHRLALRTLEDPKTPLKVVTREPAERGSP